MTCLYCGKRNPDCHAGQSCIFCGRILVEQVQVNAGTPVPEAGNSSASPRTGVARPTYILHMRRVLGIHWVVMGVLLVVCGFLPFGPLSETGHLSGYNVLLDMIRSWNAPFCVVLLMAMMVPVSAMSILTGIRWAWCGRRGRHGRSRFASGVPMLIEG